MSKPTTILDVAEALKMHKSTVSLALSGKGNVSAATRARIHQVAQEMGYEPNPLAQRLARGHQNNMVSIFSNVLDVGLATAKILQIQKELTANGLEAPLYTCPDSVEEGVSPVAQIRNLCRQRPRAIVCFTQLLHPQVFPELEAYQRSGGIVVCYDHPAPLECDQVLFDREDNAWQAATHLLELGHRQIGLAMSAPTERAVTDMGEPQSLRLKGFRRALAEWDIPVREDWIFSVPTYEKGGEELARRFLQLSDRPTALCIVNDYVALAFMVHVMAAGVRIPQDVSIVGHDNQRIATYCPVPLTSITHPVEQIASEVVQRLLARLAEPDKDPPQTVRIRGERVVRGSTSLLG